MSSDVIDLREFYATPLGKAAEASLTRAVNSALEIKADCMVVGLGYTVPILKNMNIENAIALMPARQGAVHWPVGNDAKSNDAKVALVNDDELPLANSSVDVLILLHALENTSDPIDVLNEVWRVLAPEGKVIIITANRRGIWSRFEHTPFGNGRPFSRGQLRDLLRQAKLTPLVWLDALHFPPFKRESLLKFGGLIESVAKRISPLFSGVIIVEATKRLYQGLPANAKKSRRVLVPILAPQGSASRSRKRQYLK